MSGIKMGVEKFLLVLVILIACVGTSRSQIGPHRVFVKHIVIDAEQDPRFIWAIANSAVPWGGLTTQNDLDCLKANLGDTGVFSKVALRLHKLDDPDAYELVVSLVFKRTIPTYKIENIEVANLVGVDIDALNREIHAQRMVNTVLSLRTADYAILEDRLRELIRKHTKQDQSVRPIFSLRVDKGDKVQVFVTERPTGPCIISARQPKGTARLP